MWQRTSKSVSMKRLLSLMGALLVGISFTVRAESPDAQFVRIYKLIQDADTLSANGQAVAMPCWRRLRKLTTWLARLRFPARSRC